MDEPSDEVRYTQIWGLDDEEVSSAGSASGDGFLKRIQTNLIDAGASLSADDFDETLQKLQDVPVAAPAVVVGVHVFRRAWDDVDRLEARADVLELEMARLRRWRWRRRRRVRRELGQALSGAEGLRRMFGPRP